MSDSKGISGPQFRADQPEEHETVRTTIVGGRPPGSGQPLGAVPRGVEVLVKKASVDAEFKEVLLAERAAAAERIGLALDPAETLMLSAVPSEQLEAIIARTHVPKEHRRAFLGTAAAAMLAAVGLVSLGCGSGGRPDRNDMGGAGGARPQELPPELESPSAENDATEDAGEAPAPEPSPVSRGIRPDLPAPTGIRPDLKTQ